MNLQISQANLHTWTPRQVFAGDKLRWRRCLSCRGSVHLGLRLGRTGRGLHSRSPRQGDDQTVCWWHDECRQHVQPTPFCSAPLPAIMNPGLMYSGHISKVSLCSIYSCKAAHKYFWSKYTFNNLVNGDKQNNEKISRLNLKLGRKLRLQTDTCLSFTVNRVPTCREQATAGVHYSWTEPQRVEETGLSTEQPPCESC